LVKLQARTTNGSASFFSGWSASGCSGPFHDCTVTAVDATHVAVQATFSQMANNLVFVTSTTFATNGGSAHAYDTSCNSVATAAGINDAGNAAYVAYTSDANSNAVTRLGAARGWLRMDGRPFTDTQMSLFVNNQVMNPIRFDETGAPVGSHTAPVYAMTGSLSSGVFSGVSDNCGNWSADATASAIVADPVAGPFWWNPNGFSRQACNQAGRLLCMGKARGAPLPLPSTTGKLVWVSASWPGFPSPDALCQATRPAGVTMAKALIARSNAAASTLVEPATNYIRPDGTFVGKGAQLGAGGPVESGIWQLADGTYFAGGPLQAVVLTGKNGGTAADNCNDWQPVSGTTAYAGEIPYYEAWWGGSKTSCPADTSSSISTVFYCVQVAP
jgi:hypothetical protein